MSDKAGALFAARSLVYTGDRLTNARPLRHFMLSHARHFREVIYLCAGESDDDCYLQEANFRVATVAGLGADLKRHAGSMPRWPAARARVRRLLATFSQPPIVFYANPSLFAARLVPVFRAAGCDIVPFVRGNVRYNVLYNRPWLGRAGLAHLAEKVLQARLRRYPFVVTAGTALSRIYAGRACTHVWRGTTHNEVVNRGGNAWHGRLLFVGRLDANKRCIDAIGAVEYLTELGEDVTLRIAGDGPAEARLRRYVRERHLDGRVGFLGYLGDDRQVFGELDHADVLLLTSLSEGTPKVLPEAMSRGCLVVTTPAGDAPEIVAHGRNGILVPFARPDRIAEEICKLRLDPERRLELREHACHYARENSLDRQVDRLWAAYRRATARERLS